MTSAQRMFGACSCSISDVFCRPEQVDGVGACLALTKGSLSQGEFAVLSVIRRRSALKPLIIQPVPGFRHEGVRP